MFVLLAKTVHLLDSREVLNAASHEWWSFRILWLYYPFFLFRLGLANESYPFSSVSLSSDIDPSFSLTYFWYLKQWCNPWNMSALLRKQQDRTASIFLRLWYLTRWFFINYNKAQTDTLQVIACSPAVHFFPFLKNSFLWIFVLNFSQFWLHRNRSGTTFHVVKHNWSISYILLIITLG